MIFLDDSSNRGRNAGSLPQGHIFGGLDSYDYKVAEQYHHILTDPSDYIKIYNSAHKGSGAAQEDIKAKLLTNNQESIRSYESPSKRR